MHSGWTTRGMKLLQCKNPISSVRIIERRLKAYFMGSIIVSDHRGLTGGAGGIFYQQVGELFSSSAIMAHVPLLLRCTRKAGSCRRAAKCTLLLKRCRRKTESMEICVSIIKKPGYGETNSGRNCVSSALSQLKMSVKVQYASWRGCQLLILEISR